MKTPRKTVLLTRENIEQILDMQHCLEAVEEAFAEYGRGEARMPPKVYLDIPEFNGDFRAMPAFLPKMKASGIKWVNVHPQNPSHGLPSVMATIILSDPETAYPIAVMDGTYVTSMRTGAAGGIAAKYLARKGSKVLALVGCGAQAQTQLEAVGLVFQLEKIKVFDVSKEYALSFGKRMPKYAALIQPCEDVEECVRDADIVTTVTPAREPVIMDGWLSPGTHVNAIGADAQGKQELASEITRNAKVIIDDWGQASHSGEVNIPLSSGVITRDDIHGTLGEIIVGKTRGRENDEEITVFDSTGLAVQDMATAFYAYNQCRKQGIGTEIQLV